MRAFRGLRIIFLDLFVNFTTNQSQTSPDILVILDHTAYSTASFDIITQSELTDSDRYMHMSADEQKIVLSLTYQLTILTYKNEAAQLTFQRHMIYGPYISHNMHIFFNKSLIYVTNF